jgi:arginine utilization regulatory protein
MNFPELELLLDSVTDIGIIIVDKERKIVFYNKAASIYDRIEKNAAMGINYKEIYYEEDGGAVEAVLNTGIPVCDKPAEYLDYFKEKWTCLHSIYPIFKNSEIAGVIAFTRYSEQVQELCRKALQIQQVTNTKYSEKRNGTRFTFQDIIGSENGYLRAIDQAKKAAANDASVLLLGETGTGKELFAQSIHNAGIREKWAFEAINCAAIPDNLLEGILFGTVKGAFTGAVNRAGIFELAENGTVFLDEINSMPLQLQAKMLRVVQEKRVRRVGDLAEKPITCRMISSINKSVEECLKEKTLREDLYYRLSVITIEIPPLYGRKGDIRKYATYFADNFSKKYHNTQVTINESFMKAIEHYKWPGNVRELEHLIESIVLMSEPGAHITYEHIPGHIRRHIDHSRGKTNTISEAEKQIIQNIIIKENLPLNDALIETERNVILSNLDKCNGNITKAAEIIGISRSNMQYRMKKLGIQSPRHNREGR